MDRAGSEQAGWGGERVLLVGDGEGGRGGLGKKLAEAGFSVHVAEDGRDALARVNRQPPDLVVATDEESGPNGIALVRRLRATSDVPIVVVSAAGSIHECEEAMRAGANRFLQKRFDLDRVGQVALELVRERPGVAVRSRRPWLTAAQARDIRARELSELLERLLFETRGNIAEMARRMGRDRSTVRYHLKRLGMLTGGVAELESSAYEGLRGRTRSDDRIDREELGRVPGPKPSSGRRG